MIDCKILVGVCTHGSALSRRNVCRATWLSDIPEGMAYTFFSEYFDRDTAHDSHFKDIVKLPCRGEYIYLPDKVIMFFKWALANSNFEYLVKADDDAYVVLDRLKKIARHSYPGMLGYLYYAPTTKFIQGGVYVLPRKYVEQLVKAKETRIPRQGYEDVLLSEEIKRIGGSLVDFSHVMCNTTKHVPRADNAYVSCHKVNPRDMQRIHFAFKAGTGLLGKLRYMALTFINVLRKINL